MEKTKPEMSECLELYMCVCVDGGGRGGGGRLLWGVYALLFQLLICTLYRIKGTVGQIETKTCSIQNVFFSQRTIKNKCVVVYINNKVSEPVCEYECQGG